MKISDLVKDVDYENLINPKNVEVLNLTDKSEKVTQGSIFFCLKGLNSDGHDYAKQAENRGASVIVCSHELENIKIPQLVCKDTRNAMAKIAGNFFDNPASKMKMIAITGTNGKTTTSYLIKSILESNSARVGLIGTTANYIGDIMLPPKLTTPDPIDLHHLLSKMEKAGCSHVVMEASAHALALEKLAGIQFDACVFTNLTQDHLDFFGTMEKYGEAKMKLFTPEYCKCAVINCDDEFGKKLLKNKQVPAFSYGMSNEASVCANKVSSDVLGSKYKMCIGTESMDINLNLPGDFNIYNSLAASTCSLIFGVSNNEITTGLDNVKRVEGRFNTVKSSEGFNVVIDYAHTPDGVLNILKTIKSLTKGKTITVFGCGGNRDKTKRHIMGEIASSVSDFSIITSDNPRFEKPESIIDQIEKGVKNTNYCKITDRKAAIRTAIDIAKAGDTVALLGKGAEDYQEINGIKYHFKDEEEVSNYINFKEKVAEIEKRKIVASLGEFEMGEENMKELRSEDNKLKIKLKKINNDDVTF